MKNKNTILPLLLVALFSIIIILLIVWTKSKKPAEVIPQVAPAKPAQENPDIFFASNGKNSVYKVKKGNQWSVIWNGSEGKLYDFVSNPVFSSDGSQIAYNAEIGGQAYVVVNNTQEIQAYQKANYITFSKDGSTIAFVATRDSNDYVTISAKITDIANTLAESASYSNIGVTTDADGNSTAIIMSDDGDRIAYLIEEDGLIYIVIDGEMSEGYDNIISFSFSEDGTDFTYEAQDGDTVVTITNNQTTSSVDDSSSTSDTSYTNRSYTNYPTPDYRYKVSTDKDIVLDQDRLDYTGCPEGSQCNF
jgi:hypothetical protein